MTIERFFSQLYDKAVYYLKATRLADLILLWIRTRSVQKVSLSTLKKFGADAYPKEEQVRLLEDIKYCAKKWRFSIIEYFKFNLKDKTEEERASFISEVNRIHYANLFNKPRNLYLFSDKFATSKKFAKYFKRECIFASSRSDLRKVEQFLLKRRVCVVKPIASSTGIGVRVLEIENDADAQNVARLIIDEYCKKPFYGAILEEKIIQDETMNKLHPQSVNTIRITTIRLNDRTVIFHPNLRIGVGSSQIDNAAQGGILAGLDAETGVVIAAQNKQGEKFVTHPDTGAQILGFQVPHWEEAKAFVKELATVIPSNRYTGWDVALTKDGWSLVEANARGQMGAQMFFHTGFKKEVLGYLRELGIRCS